MLQELLKITNRPLTASEFAKVFFDFEPYKYQMEPMNLNARFKMYNWARQTGKSTNAALEGLYACMSFDDYVTVILAPKQQQAGRLFKRVRAFLRISDRKFPELELSSNISRETQRLVEFDNGSSIECLTIGDDGGNIRGITANFQIIDEVAQIKNEEAWSAINPMILATKGKQLLISTPKGVNNYFYTCFKNGTHKYFHATSFENPNADRLLIEQDKQRMPDILWREEYLAEWIEESHVFFPLSLIDERMNNTLQERNAPLYNCTYYLGVDPASIGLDSTVFCILEQHSNWEAIVRYIEVKNEDLMQIAGRIKHLHKLFHFRKVFVDQTGVGQGLVDFLLSGSGVPVEGVWQTAKTKQDMYNNLKTCMQNGLGLLQNDTARKQLADIRWDYTEGETLKIYAQQSKQHNLPGGDDYPTAMALAALALKQPTQPIISARGRGAYA